MLISRNPQQQDVRALAFPCTTYMALSTEQERYLHSVLDQGLQKLTPTFSDSPSIITKASLSFAESQSLHSEVQALSQRVIFLQSVLEDRSKSSSPVPQPALRSRIPPQTSPLPANSSEFKVKLVQERRNQQVLTKANARLRQSLRSSTDLQAEADHLTKDLLSLRDSFHQSELIRLKQKKLIDQLRRELGWEPQAAYKPILKPVRREH